MTTDRVRWHLGKLKGCRLPVLRWAAPGHEPTAVTGRFKASRLDPLTIKSMARADQAKASIGNGKLGQQRR